MTTHPYAVLGALIGIASGFAGAFGGFSAFVIVLVLGLIGLGIGRVADGDLDLTGYLDGARNRRRVDR